MDQLAPETLAYVRAHDKYAKRIIILHMLTNHFQASTHDVNDDFIAPADIGVARLSSVPARDRRAEADAEVVGEAEEREQASALFELRGFVQDAGRGQGARSPGSAGVEI